MNRDILKFDIYKPDLGLDNKEWSFASCIGSVSGNVITASCAANATNPSLLNRVGQYMTFRKGRRYKISFSANSQNALETAIYLSDYGAQNVVVRLTLRYVAGQHNYEFEFIAGLDSTANTYLRLYVSRWANGIANSVTIENVKIEECLAEGLGDVEITEYTFTPNRMGMPTLSASLMFPVCLDDLWTHKEYVTIRGEKYFVRDTPTSSKDNTDARYKHQIEFKCEREILGEVLFYDTVSKHSVTHDKPCSNSTTFSFYGTLTELVDRINCSLLNSGIGDSLLEENTLPSPEDTPSGDGYCVILDTTGDYDPSVVKEVSFSEQFILGAINEGYNTFEIPYEFRGKQIVFGALPKVFSKVLEYGVDDALLSVQKNNANVRVINRITFKGSSENIPYYYPNESEYGHIVVESSRGTANVTNMTRLLSNARAEAKIEYIKETTIVGGEINYSDIGYKNSSTQDKEDSYVPGEWIEAKTSTLHLSIRVKLPATRFIFGSLFMRFWQTNEASPAEAQNVLASIAYIKSVALLNVTGVVLYDPISRSTDGSLDFGDVTEGEYSLEVDLQDLPTDCRWAITSLSFPKYENVNYYWKCGDVKKNSLSDFGLASSATPQVGDWFKWRGEGRMPFQTNLVPPIFRNTLGKERFYIATNNPSKDAYVDEQGVRHAEAYTDPDTGQQYNFKNPYTEGNPHDYEFTDETIKPTIKGIKNADDELFGEIADIAFDTDDNDLLKIGSEENADTYEHSYFYIKLHKFNGDYGFDLFKSASQSAPMTLQMTSGACNGCKFKIQAIEGEVWQNPVQTDGADGDILNGNYADKVDANNPQTWQQDTEANSIWICVQKDTDTFGIIMPNRTNDYLPKIGDTFNITNIILPEPYLRAAEKLGEEAMMRFMADNNDETFAFDIKCSRVFFAENPDLLAELDENCIVNIKYNGTVYPLYITAFTISCKDSEALPEIQITVSKELATSQSFLEATAARAATLIANATALGGSPAVTGGGMSFSVADTRYVNKTRNDRSPHRIATDSAFEIGNFLAGASGGIFSIDPETGQTYIEADRLHIRMKAIFAALEIARVQSIGGEFIITKGGSTTITFVEKDTAAKVYRCFFKGKDDEQGAECRFSDGDLVRCQNWNIGAGLHQNASNKHYWRMVTKVDNDGCFFELSMTDYDTASSDEPAAGDVVCHIGNHYKSDRRSAIVLSTVNEFAPSITLYDDINTYSLSGKAVVSFGVRDGKPFFEVGDNNGNIKYSTSDGLSILGRISASSTIGDQSLNEYIRDNAGVDSALKILEAWAADGVFNPGELDELEFEQKRISSESSSLSKQYEQYSGIANNVSGLVAAKNDYDSAYANYNAILTSLLTATRDENGCVAIPAQFATVMSNYYARKADLEGLLTGASKYFAMNQVADLDYLKVALAQKSITEGGLFLTSLIALGVADPQYPDDITKRTTWSGMNGVVGSKGMRSIAMWYGGSMADLEDYYQWDEDSYGWKLKNGISQAQANAANIAKGLDRMDGSGYRAGGSLWWDTTGKLYADPMSFIIGENYVGVNLALFQINPNNAAGIEQVNYVTPMAPFSKLEMGLKNAKGTLGYDTDKGVFQTDKALICYEDVVAFGDGSTTGGSSGGGMNEEELEAYLKNNGYATQIWVNLQGFLTSDNLTDYLTKTDASSLYQPKGDYLTSSSLADYIKTSDADAKYVTLSGAQHITGQKTFGAYVGIGIRNPEYMLDVYGQLRAHGVNVPDGGGISWTGGAALWLDPENNRVVINRETLVYGTLGASNAVIHGGRLYLDEANTASMWWNTSGYVQLNKPLVCGGDVVAFNDGTALPGSSTGGGMSEEEVESYLKNNDYLTKPTADGLYQPKGDYLTQHSLAGYMKTADADAKYVTLATAQTITGAKRYEAQQTIAVDGMALALRSPSDANNMRVALLSQANWGEVRIYGKGGHFTGMRTDANAQQLWITKGYGTDWSWDVRMQVGTAALMQGTLYLAENLDPQMWWDAESTCIRVNKPLTSSGVVRAEWFAANTKNLCPNLNAEFLGGINLAGILASNVASATKLQTSRKLWGRPFDGTADVSGDMSGVGSITMSGTLGISAFDAIRLNSADGNLRLRLLASGNWATMRMYGNAGRYVDMHPSADGWALSMTSNTSDSDWSTNVSLLLGSIVLRGGRLYLNEAKTAYIYYDAAAGCIRANMPFVGENDITAFSS